MKVDECVDESGYSCQGVRTGADLLARPRLSQNLVGPKLLISLSVRAWLGSNVLQMINPRRILDMWWLKVGWCVNASAYSCQGIRIGASPPGRPKVCSRIWSTTSICLSVCVWFALQLLQIVDPNTVLDS